MYFLSPGIAVLVMMFRLFWRIFGLMLYGTTMLFIWLWKRAQSNAQKRTEQAPGVNHQGW